MAVRWPGPRDGRERRREAVPSPRLAPAVQSVSSTFVARRSSIAA